MTQKRLRALITIRFRLSTIDENVCCSGHLSLTESLSQQQLHSRYVLQLLLETWKLMRMMPNINRISTCHSKEITICGELREVDDFIFLIWFLLILASTAITYKQTNHI